MPLPNNQANKQKEIQDKISNFADHLGPAGAKGVVDLIGLATDSKLDAIGFLKRLTNDVNVPVLQPLANDLIEVLGSFYTSEEVLCCLIKNLLVTTKLGQAIEDAKKKLKDELDRLSDKEKAAIVVGTASDPVTLLTFSVAELGFIDTIDQLIFIIDTILAIMGTNITDIMIPPLDFSKLLSDSIVGMICIALQEIIFTLRDSAIAWIVDALTKNVGNQAWIKCFPYMGLIQILKEYIHDYGLLDKLFKLIEGFVGGKHAKFKKYLEAKYPKNVKDMEFLKWLRDVLIKIRNAAISWEFCVDLNFDPTDADEKTEVQKNIGIEILKDDFKKKITGKPDDNINTTLGDNNTILINGDIENQINKDKIGDFRPPSNSEVNTFLVNHMGISKDLADQLTGLTDRDNVQGSLSSDPHTTNNDCGYVLSVSDLDSQIRKLLRSNGLV